MHQFGFSDLSSDEVGEGDTMFSFPTRRIPQKKTRRLNRTSNYPIEEEGQIEIINIDDDDDEEEIEIEIINTDDDDEDDDDDDDDDTLQITHEEFLECVELGVTTRLSMMSNDQFSIPKEEENEQDAPDTTSNSELCIICLTRLKTTCILDCSHMCMCVTCSRHLVMKSVRQCPMCRKNIIKGIIRVYK